MTHVPQRIVCLSAEAADWLWRIGAWDRVVGVTAYFTQPNNAPHKPHVSGFSSANLEQIAELNPDLIITFSDVQARLASELMRRGFNVLATNQRTLAETGATLSLLARVAGCEREARPWLREFQEKLAPVAETVSRPRVYFEEWNDPLISGIAWIGELIERAGGKDIFSNLRDKRSAPERVVSHEQIIRANPEIILASWCGKPLDASAVAARPGWRDLDALRGCRVYEIPGADILQPGYRLIHGYERMKQLIKSVAQTSELVTSDL